MARLTRLTTHFGRYTIDYYFALSVLSYPNDYVYFRADTNPSRQWSSTRLIYFMASRGEISYEALLNDNGLFFFTNLVEIKGAKYDQHKICGR